LALFKGLDLAFGGLSVLNNLVTVKFFALPPPPYDKVTWGIQILAIISYLGHLALEILWFISQYSLHQLAFFLFGVAIVTFLNAIFFYSFGRTSEKDKIVYEEYLASFEDAVRDPKELFWDIIGKDMFPTLIDHFIWCLWLRKGEDIPEDIKCYVVNIVEFGFLSILPLLFSIHDWWESLQMIRLVSKASVFRRDHYYKHLKAYFYLMLSMTAFFSIWGYVSFKIAESEKE